jgi:hypothetical protein
MRDNSVTLKRSKKSKLPPKIAYKELIRTKVSKVSSKVTPKVSPKVSKVSSKKLPKAPIQVRKSERLRNKNVKQVSDQGFMFNNEIEQIQTQTVNWSEWIAATDTKNYL